MLEGPFLIFPLLSSLVAVSWYVSPSRMVSAAGGSREPLVASKAEITLTTDRPAAVNHPRRGARSHTSGAQAGFLQVMSDSEFSSNAEVKPESGAGLQVPSLPESQIHLVKYVAWSRCPVRFLSVHQRSCQPTVNVLGNVNLPSPS